MSAQAQGAPGDWQRDVFRELGGAASAGAAQEAAAPAALPPAPPAPGEPARHGRPLPPPTPVSVPVVGPALDGSGPRHGDPLPRRAGRALRRGLTSSAARQTETATRIARAIQQPITTGRQIAVTSIRGGAGKSTVAALLALTLAHHRHDPVLAVEADPALGTLPRRLGATEIRWSCGDLAGIVDPSMQITDVTGYLLPFAGGGWLLPGSQGTIGARLDVETYRIVMTSLRRWFGTTVVDCETLPAEVARTALTTTQARVLVAPATTAGAATTRSVLDWMGGLHRSMLPTTVVVLVHTAPDMGLDGRRAAEYLGAGGARVIPLPYDRSLAAGGEIRTALLAGATREAAALIAAETMDRAMTRGSSRGGPR
ncbi:MinD/ParA family ATP-binding protein [Streptomyces sp. URMC 129]|uniref:MinD/ParA family ATP-binding protein n=1 Tax=Streptomyces sp. URMC 129 TaxID=3423407 RepID=UPI003F1A01D7